jgi:ectoine hydroxylase-related dioxygenase (phytanoyl-CoA dioxygenase family)
VDVSPHNGSTEIWPGTHKDTTVYVQRGDIKVPADKVEARRRASPPVQPCVRAGSVLIRDMRLWHAGMPNWADTPRPMIAMIHWVSWWNAVQPMVFPKGTEELVEHRDLTSVANFVDGPIDYLNRHQAYDYHC